MAAELQLRLTGGAANADPDASLGGVMSSQELAGVAMNNLFDDVSPAERVAGDVEYRALDIYNAGDADAAVVKAYMDPVTSSPGTDLAFGLDSTTQEIADEDTPPSSVTFANYSAASKLSIADIEPASAQRIWFRRTVQAGATNNNNDLGTIKVEYA